MSVKRRFSTRWGHPYHLQGACTECRQTLLHPLCSITPMTLESYTEYSAQSKREDTSVMHWALTPRGMESLQAKKTPGTVSPLERGILRYLCLAQSSWEAASMIQASYLRGTLEKPPVSIFV